MKRPVRDPIKGTYTIKDVEYNELFGSREKVMNGTAYKTSGELTKDDLVVNKHGRIVSKVKYDTSRKERRLEKYGYFAKKGKFGYIKKGTKRRSNKKRKKSTRKNRK